MAPAPARSAKAGQRAAPPPPPTKVRHRKGKPGGAVEDSDSDDEEETLEIRRTAAPVKLEAGFVAGGAGRVLKSDAPIKVGDLSKAKLDGGVRHGEW